MREALRALGVRRLLLSVHDLAFPGDPRDDIGRGAPLSRGGRAFLRFAAELGFHGLQLGPQGETAPHDPSPYDATLFSRNTLSIAVTPLVEQGLLTEEELGAVVGLRPADALSRAAHADAHESARRLLAAAWLRARGDRAVQERVRRFTERNRAWLERANVQLLRGADADRKLAELRRLYVPYVRSLAALLLVPLPDWTPGTTVRDNWQTTAWARTGKQEDHELDVG